MENLACFKNNFFSLRYHVYEYADIKIVCLDPVKTWKAEIQNSIPFFFWNWMTILYNSKGQLD